MDVYNGVPTDNDRLMSKEDEKEPTTFSIFLESVKFYWTSYGRFGGYLTIVVGNSIQTL
jgi:hypothetical protein